MKSNKTTFFAALMLVWLIGLVFFGSKLVMTFVDRKSDERTIKDLHQAITSYHSENKRYPGQADHQTNDIDLQSDFLFMALLCPKPSPDSKTEEAGPAKPPLFVATPAVQDPKTGKWRNGLILDTPETGGLFNKRGDPFRIRLDASGDGKVYSPINNEELNEIVLIWTAGKDGKFETWWDNGRSWK